MADRNQGGIMGTGGKNVAPIYKPQGTMMGPAKIQGPQVPKKKNQSLKDKINKALNVFEENFGGDTYYGNGYGKNKRY